jgi:hypothetical protein
LRGLYVLFSLKNNFVKNILRRKIFYVETNEALDHLRGLMGFTSVHAVAEQWKQILHKLIRQLKHKYYKPTSFDNTKSNNLGQRFWVWLCSPLFALQSNAGN